MLKLWRKRYKIRYSLTTGVLLINLGTPPSPHAEDVKRYLTEFLNDPFVMDMPAWQRYALVNWIIVPFRAKKSAAAYKKIWLTVGSPLLVHGKELVAALQQSLGNEFTVALGMRYGQPSIQSAMEELSMRQPEKIMILPLYPQYAASTTGSSIEKAMEILRKVIPLKDGYSYNPGIKIITKFYDDIGFLNAWTARAKEYEISSFNHILFSFHGLPEKHLIKAHEGVGCEKFNCRTAINRQNQYCYRAACYETARQIAARLAIPNEKYSISFQSRLGKNIWMQPYTDKTVAELAKQGIKRLLVFSPSFVADCLETLFEIGIEMKHLFKKAGGEELRPVESLNRHPAWTDAVQKLILHSYN